MWWALAACSGSSPTETGLFDVAELAGNWVGTADFPSGEVSLEATFELAGTSLTGPMALDNWQYTVDTAAADNDSAWLVFTDPMSQRELTMDLWRQDDTLLGTFEENRCAPGSMSCLTMGALEASLQ